MGGGEQEWTAQVGQPNAAFMGPLETQGQENHSQFTQGLCTMEVTSTPKSPIQTKISVLCCIFSWISWAQEVWRHCVLANRICSLFYESWPLRALGEQDDEAEMVWQIGSWGALSHGVHFAIGVRPYPGQAWLRERSILDLQGYVLNKNMAPFAKKTIKKF